MTRRGACCDRSCTGSRTPFICGGPMSSFVLITGGAGFIGSHLADELLRRGYRVRALDNLSPQVHGPEARRPEYLASDVELQVGDVRDPDAVRRALSGVDAVFHFAAMVGVGQSMYEVERYTDVNNRGTAVLLEALAQQPVAKLVVASSMSIYGEGLYRTADGREAEAVERARDQFVRGDWEVRGPDGETLTPAPTPESKRPTLASVYALSKYDQERLCLMIGEAYNIPTVALRFFNVYGTRRRSSRTASNGATSSACSTWRAPAGWRWSPRTRADRWSTSAAGTRTRCA